MRHGGPSHQRLFTCRYVAVTPRLRRSAGLLLDEVTSGIKSLMAVTRLATNDLNAEGDFLNQQRVIEESLQAVMSRMSS